MDWRVLRGALVTLVVAVLVSGGALAGSLQFAQSKNILHKRARAAYLSARAQYHDLDQEEGLIATYLPRYVALENAGIVGREKRLDWIESLRQSAKQAQVVKLRYKIDTQKPFDTGIKLEVGNFRVFASTMNISVDLLHEGDLFVLLDNINRSAKGLYGLSDCDIRRRGETINVDPEAVNLVAQCDLKFLTIRKSETEDQS